MEQTYLNYNNFSLPKSADPNEWADHIEFYCFLSKDNFLSVEIFLDKILDDNSNDSVRAINRLSSEEVEEYIQESLKFDEGTDEDPVISESVTESIYQDRLREKVNRFFGFLKTRQNKFKNNYPFIINGNTLQLKNDLSEINKLYLILLISSLLRLATKSGINKLGHLFEILCDPVFEKLLPKHSEKYFFGSGNVIISDFSGSLYDKFLKLANILHIDPTTKLKRKNINATSGDGGLDWVGVFNFNDNLHSQPVFFGQCACGADWIDKQFDAHRSKWKNYLQLDNYLIYHFIPRNFRNELSHWFDETEIIDVVLIDRLRIIDALEQYSELTKQLSLYNELFSEINNNKIDYFN